LPGQDAARFAASTFRPTAAARGDRRRCRGRCCQSVTRFHFPWTWDGGEAILQSRCVDDTGYVQPTLGQLIAVRGLNGPLGSIYHLNAIQSWHVASDGKVTNVHYY